MRRIISIFLCALLFFASIQVPTSAISYEKGFKIYPFDPYIVQGLVEMTPNGGYKFTANGGADLTYVMAAVNTTGFDYETNNYLHLVAPKSNMKFNVQIGFHNTLDGYFIPEHVVYSSEASVNEKIISINIKEALEKKDSWIPDGNILFICIYAQHKGDIDSFTVFDSMRLGPKDIVLTHSYVKPVKIDMLTDSVADNLTLEAILDDGFSIKKTDFNTTASCLKVNIQYLPETPYLYINFFGLPHNNWPYIYIYDKDNQVMGAFPKVIRVRPDLGDSVTWVRVDLRNVSESFRAANGDLGVKIVLETPEGASQTPLKLGGVFLGGEQFVDREKEFPDVSAPLKTEEPLDESQEPTTSTFDNTSKAVSSVESKDEISKASNNNSSNIIWYIVGALVLITAATIVVFINKKKK